MFLSLLLNFINANCVIVCVGGLNDPIPFVSKSNIRYNLLLIDKSEIVKILELYGLDSKKIKKYMKNYD